MSQNLNMPTQPFALYRALLNRYATRKIFLTLLLTTLVAIPLMLGLEHVHSAPLNPAIPAPAAATSSVILTDVPPEALIGEPVKFKVTFRNPGPGIGFAPFIDLVLDAGGANIGKLPGPCACDGITLVKAEVIGLTGGPLDVTPPPSSQILTSPCGSVTNNNVVHPFAISGILPVNIPIGAQLVTITLPFGSYNPTPPQPDIVVEVTAMVSNLADYNVPLTISARGGFKYGADPLDNPLTDLPILSDVSANSAQWAAQAQTTPTVMIIKKEYLGPENETATGPNFPHDYKITADIADGQSIANLIVQDFLPNNMQYLNLVGVTIHGNPANQGPSCGSGVDYVLTQPSTTVPGGTLGVSFCAPIVGAPLPPDDVIITFSFYIPKVDSGGGIILPTSCVPALSKNNIRAEGDWTPLDSCDSTPVHVISDVTNVDHTLSDKCIAVQKSVTIATDLNAPGLTPDDILRYEINFQLTDYKTFGYLNVVDFLSDGQQLLLGPPVMSPKLTVKDQFGTTSGIFLLNIDLLKTPVPPIISCAGAVKLTRLTFQVSTKMVNVMPTSPRHAAGILTGGYATTPTSTTPATGQIVFYAKVLDQFTSTYSTGDQFVDKDDPMTNCITMTGRVFTNSSPQVPLPTATTVIAHDDSKTVTAIVTDTIKKTVYNVMSGSTLICGPTGIPCTSLPGPPEVHPGDQVTFRIEKTIPSSDAELLKVEDFWPLPVFDVNDPDANGVAGPSWPSSVTATCSPIPAPGLACKLAPTNTLAVTPTLSLPTGTNSTMFNFGTFNDTTNQPHKIDLLFTSTVTTQPFADGLFLTNEAQECENNTFGFRFCQAAIAQINLREPNLRIRKGAIATDNPNGQFSQPGPPPQPNLATAQAPSGVTFSLAGFTGIISSPVSLLDSNLTNVDANDWVTFAIVIENQGGHPAYDVKLTDTVPSCFTNVTALSAKWGTGVPLPSTSYTITPPSPSFTFTLNAASSIPGNSVTANGANIIVITFRAQLLSNITPGCCDNVAELKHYASQPGGPDFVSAGFTPPFKDPATVCVKPTADKCVNTTSEPHTQADNSQTGSPQPPQVAIGEIVRYRLKVTLPEGISPFFRLTDHLPPGLTYMNDGTTKVAFISNTGITSTTLSGLSLNIIGGKATCLSPTPTFVLPAQYITGGAFASGTDPTFNLGTLTNNDNDPGLEFVIVDFNALVNNLPPNPIVSGPPNQNGALLSNNYDVFVGKVIGTPTPIATSPTINVKIVEPNLVIQKTVTPPNPVGTRNFTVSLTNNGTADAFDVHLTDAVPPGFTLLNTPPPSVSVAPSACAVPTLTIAGNTLTVDVPRIPVAPSCTVTLTFTVRVNYCDINTAQVTYTSLPGNAPAGTQPNNTGSVTPCQLATHEDCERVYVSSAQAVVNTGCAPACATRPPGMVGWWPMNVQGGAVNDIAPPPDSMVNNMGNSPAYQPVVGNVGGPLGALFFGSIVQVPNQSELNFGTGDFSIDAWVRIVMVGPLQISPIVDKFTMAGGPGFAFYIRNQKLELNVNGTTLVSTAPPMSFANPIANTGPWYHVAVTVKRSTSPQVIFYINGLPVGPFTTVPLTSVNNGLPLWIGGTRLLPGVAPGRIAIDELELFNSVLTQVQIKSIFDAGSTGKCRP